MGVRLRTRQGGRRVDLALGLLLLTGVVTGLSANTVGVDWPLDLIQLHAAGALAILLLAPWKYVVIRRGLRRPGRRPAVKWLSITLALLVLTTIASGLIHSTGHLEDVGPLTLMQIHVGAAVTALAVLAAHFGTHVVRPRRADVDRRAMLRLAALAAGAAAATTLWDRGPGDGRRFTGSVPKPDLLVTSWLDDSIQHIDPAQWTLRVGPTTFDLTALHDLPHERFTAVLDCTSGWYTEQQWDGVRLSVLLAAAGVPRNGWRTVEARSATGYSRWFGAATLTNVWLVTAVADRPLSYGHGFPARIVAPGRRGFWWVKWVTSIQPSARPPWAQPVFPLT
ncbi:molybdopterin-dependent oxidoreductase [Dactylosporangium sp. McL0621]|uniref:molybdopterin-dependent oxidoreductase n=1 Tax=Dactylosporangium sp. McL0621 TaxID=3415678 RepID=UPI003CFB854A